MTTASGQYEADYVVLAAGRGIPPLAAQAGVEVPLADKPPTLNVYTEPAPRMLHHILLSGRLHFFRSLLAVAQRSACRGAAVSYRMVPDPCQTAVFSLLRFWLLADALFLRQARDGTVLISVYKEDAAAALRLPPEALEDPAQLQAVGQQVRLLRGAPLHGSSLF